MGVCIEERPVMHWQQSARFLGPPRERSPTIPSPLVGQCSAGNNNHPLHRASCPDSCEHINNNNNNNNNNINNNNNNNINNKHFGQSPTIFNDPCRSFETPERTIFDETSLNFNDVQRGDCSEGGSSGISSSCLQLKSEPLCGPSSPDSASEITNGPDDCAGCGRLIQDRFYLSAVDKRWHAGCLQCCICRQTLDGETSCFSRDGNIYCKSDYYRVFCTRTCSRCMASISSSELVMRAKHLVFHVHCFSCATCQSPLTKGDQFGMRESTVYCRLHYYESTLDNPTTLNSCQYGSTQYGSSPNEPGSPIDDSNLGDSTSCGKLSTVGSGGYFGPGGHGLSSITQPPRQKGRPRKRKPKDIEAMTASLDLNSDYLDLGFGRHGLGSSSRAKRMRTSFKHHQLRTMKSYFAINHNPDAKDLKQLSQKTGLPKRVLQVWFQNARAKWRRLMMKQEGKGGGSEKGDGSLDLDSFGSHSSPFMLGGPPSPHSID